MLPSVNTHANGQKSASDAACFVIADKKYGEILVFTSSVPAVELINEASSIIEMEITVEEMFKTIHGHPTYSEVIKMKHSQSVLEWLSIHLRK